MTLKSFPSPRGFDQFLISDFWVTRALIVQLFEYGLKPSIGRVDRLGLGGAARDPEVPTALGGLEDVPSGSTPRGTGFPIFSAALTRTSKPRMITMLLFEAIGFRICVMRAIDLPSVLNRVHCKSLDANNASFPHISVLQH